MANGLKENDFQHGMLLPHLTGINPGELGWILGKPNDIDPVRWIAKYDLLEFLRDGNPLNKRAFAEAKSAGKYPSDEAFLEAFIDQALMPKIESEPNAVFALRDGVKFAGKSFTLWNEAPRAGGGSDMADLFERNLLRVIPEAPFMRRFPLTGRSLSRRPDLVFFVNGLYFAYSELKTAQTGQTARNKGRGKIAGEFVEATKAALLEARARWDASGAKWPGFRNRSMPASEKNRIRQDICLYEKAVHISAIDMGTILMIADTDWILADVDDAIIAGDELAFISTLPDRVESAFMQAVEIRDKTGFEALLDHIAALFAKEAGIDREIAFFNQIRASRTTTVSEILRPWPAQRTMLFQALRRVGVLYEDESVPKISADSIRERLAKDLPGLDEPSIAKIVSDSLLHRNGTESHSIILQGAAGLGKTNVIVWLAQALADMPANGSKALYPLFDLIVLLTDRTELRRNIADEARRLSSTKGIVREAESFSDLREALELGARVVVVNIQKFPSMRKLSAEDPELGALLKNKRVAMIIDEVHRSQNGVLHDDTLAIFDEWGSVRPDGAKRNLIIGLTATPRDEILARYGEWRSASGPGDKILWAPFFSYAMKQAIRDGVVLNPIQNVIRFEDHLKFDVAKSFEEADFSGKKLVAPSMDSIYENRSRQQKIAKEAVRIFAAKTMMAIRPVGGRALGEGKAMFAAYSINAAIAYQQLLKEELLALAEDPLFAEHKETLKRIPVLLTFSDRQGLTKKCSELNDGMSQDDVIDAFRRKGAESNVKDGEPVVRNAIIVVVDKLLTGFDEPSLHTIFIDRALDDVLLFQAACRVNRRKKWKRDCLVVDFSHGGEVSKNLPKVFEKYGGITVSDLDPIAMLERMEAAFSILFRNKELSAHWKGWKALGGKGEPAKALSDYLDATVKSNRQTAVLLRKAATSWFSLRETLHGILDFGKQQLTKHDEKDRAAFAKQIADHLGARLADTKDEEHIEAVFDVDLVEEAGVFTGDIFAGDMPKEEEKPKKRDQNMPISIGSILEDDDVVSDIMATLADLQKAEDDREQMLIKPLRDFLSDLLKAIDQKGKGKNNDFYRKKVLEMALQGKDFAWDERREKFDDLLGEASIDLGLMRNPYYKAFMAPLMRRRDLVMADYEEWVSRGNGKDASSGAGISS